MRDRLSQLQRARRARRVTTAAISIAAAGLAAVFGAVLGQATAAAAPIRQPTLHSTTKPAEPSPTATKRVTPPTQTTPKRHRQAPVLQPPAAPPTVSGGTGSSTTSGGS